MTVDGFQEDLFRPTISPAHDRVQYNAPWNPKRLVFFTVFLGLQATAILFAFNYRKLGMPKYFWRTLAGGLIVVFLLLATQATIIDHYDLRGDSARGVRFGLRVLHVALAGLLAWTQSHRYHLARLQDVEQGKLLWPVIGAGIAGVCMELGLVACFVWLTMGS